MADRPPVCHLLLVLMLLHLVIASAQLEPAISPGEAPNDNVQKLASPPVLPSSLLGPVEAPAFSPTIDFPAAESPEVAPTPAAHSPTTLSPSGSADTPPTGSIVTISMSSPPSQGAPASALESTPSPPAPPSTPFLAVPPSPSLPTTPSSKEGLSAAKKAGISMGVLLTVAMAGLIAFIIKRRKHNIQRSQQYRGYRGDTL